MNVYDFARRHLYPYKTKGAEIVPDRCPYCQGGKHRDKETFALNIEKLTYNCKRGSCGQQGHFTQLCKDFGEVAEVNNNFEVYKPKKTYKKPTTVIKEVTTAAEKYLGLRKISKATMEAYKVGCDDKGNIVFPFYDENNDLQFVKFRPAKKVEKGERKSWREEGGKPILFGMDQCTPDLPLVITEGEIDCLSVYEAGVKNAVSIPSGCEDVTWLETCYEWLENFNKIILCGDNDNAGKEMVRKLTAKLGGHRCSIVTLDRKDANETLFYEGKEALKNYIDNAKDVPIYGLIDLADVTPLDTKNMTYVRTGIQGLDSETGGCLLGDVSVWTGKRGEGKSTIMGTVLLEAIEHNQKVCAYSGELRADRFQYWINLQAAGKEHISSYFDTYRNKDVQFLEDDVRSKIVEWYRGKFFLYDNAISSENTEEASILKVFEYAAKKHDCKIFLVDNLMTAKSSSRETDFYLQQIDFVKDLINFANKYNVHVHLVAHPKKTNGSLSNDDISGRSEITNLAHNVFSIEKNTDEQYKCDTIVRVLKNRWEGSNAEIGLNFCPISKRLYMPSIGAYRKYSWSKEKPQKPNYDICPF